MKQEELHWLINRVGQLIEEVEEQGKQNKAEVKINSFYSGELNSPRQG